MLIPSTVKEKLDPDRHLLIAPHRKLHAVPWAALQPEFSPEPLVSVCIPTIVPSLHSQVRLWQRQRSEYIPGRDTGLVMGVSHFQGRHADLPSVRAELAALRSRLGPAAQHLAEEKATWENLLKVSREGGPP